MKEMVVVELTDSQKFEDVCNGYLSDGYIVSSTSCGFANSEKYDFCSCYHAVLIRRVAVTSDNTPK